MSRVPVNDNTDITNRRIVLLLVACTSFTTPVMHSAVVVAMPTMASDLQTNAVLINWVATAYLLAHAIFLLPAGKLGDIHGLKKLYFLGLLAFSAASMLVAAAPGIYSLILFRFVQGAAAAMIVTTGMSMIVSVYPASQRGSIIGLISAATYTGLTSGPLLGGLFTDYLSWHWIFLFHVPLMLILAVLCRIKLRGDWSGDSGQHLDKGGALIFGMGMISLIFGLSVLPGMSAVLIIFTGLLLLMGFTRYEKRQSMPMLDIRLLLENRLFLFSSLAALLMYISAFGVTYLLSLYLQYIKAVSAQQAGFILMIQPVILALLSPLTGRLSDRHEPRILTSAGMTLSICGYVLLVFSGENTSLYFIYTCLTLLGAGFALFSSPNMNAILGSVPRDSLGVASGITNTVRVIGQMLSMAMITLIFAVYMGPVQITPEQYPALLKSISLCFFLSILFGGLSLWFCLARGKLH